MIKRPQPGEDEEDILRMQEEYLNEKSRNKKLQPAALVTSLRPIVTETTNERKRAKSNVSGERKPSKYAQAKGLSNQDQKNKAPSSTVMGDIIEKNVDHPVKLPEDVDDDQVYFPVILPSVLGNIVEKYSDDMVDLSVPMPAQGFPEVVKRDPQFMAQKRKKKFEYAGASESVENMDTQTVAPLNIPEKSFIVSSSEAEQIHRDNVSVLTKMSESEILEEQQKLLSNMDTSLVEFLKSKRKNTQSVAVDKEIQQKDNLPERMDISVTQIPKHVSFHSNILEVKSQPLSGIAADELWENDVLSHPNTQKWLHFDTLENDKLQWMKGIEESKKLKNDEPYEARFDFNGYLLPYTMEYTEQTKTLFHHGEEPHRPGYSLTELFELSRSTVLQQRVVALNTIAGILEYTTAGFYKNIIEIPLSKIFFIIRIAMDENKVIILEPALKAMRNMLFNRIDEASLDALLGFEEGMQQPCLENDKSDIEELESKESELKDFHLAEIDLIAVALRTDIVQRLFYILENVRPSFNCVQYCLQILTRISRDSVDTAAKLVNSEHLMKSIVGNFMPTTSVNFVFDPHLVYKGKPVLAALKLLRVLSLQSREISQALVEKYGILRPVAEYVSSGVDGTYGLRIQIEAFCILSNLLYFGIGIEDTRSLCPVIATTLYKHVNGTDIHVSSSVPSATHAAVVLQCVKSVLHTHMTDIDQFKQQIYPLLKEGTQKWLAQLSNSDNYSCGHLRLLCSALDCCKTIQLVENIPLKFLNDSLVTLSKSKGYTKIIQNLIPSSNLLSGFSKGDIFTIKNLMSLGGSVLESAQKMIPSLNMSSPLPFLASLFRVLELIEEADVSRHLVKPLDVYLRRLAAAAPALCDNWFTRIEVDFLCSVLRVAIKNEIAEADKDLLYAIANKLCYILRIDKKEELNFIFNNIVFNQYWFTADRLMSIVSISETNVFSKVMNSIDEVKQCYATVINLNYTDTGRNVVLRNWQEPILPRDWIYLPILHLYSSSQLNDVDRWAPARKAVVITCSLEWILFNELCFPDLIKDITLTDRFCRLMCVFLCDNSLFLDDNVKPLLRSCIQTIFRKEKEQPFDFERPLVGLHNFQDLYTQFVDQFQSVSYGDATFAACVLAPLAQQHAARWRRLVWSEYAGCLRALHCAPEHLPYRIQHYLHPEETDDSLIHSYFRALAGNLLRPDTIPHTIALHHTQAYKNRKKSLSKT